MMRPGYEEDTGNPYHPYPRGYGYFAILEEDTGIGGYGSGEDRGLGRIWVGGGYGSGELSSGEVTGPGSFGEGTWGS